MNQYALSAFKTAMLTALLSAAVVITGCSKQSGPQALLEKVEQHYSELNSFDLQATITTDLDRGGQSRTMSFPIRYAKGEEGKLRIQVDHDQMGLKLVSDGSTTWTYLPSVGQYTKEQAAAIGAADEVAPQKGPSADFVDMAEQLVQPMSTITEDLVKVEDAGKDTLSLNGESRVVRVVKVTYKKDPQMGKADVTPTSYWIDPNTDWVLQQRYTVSMDDPQMGGKASMKQTMRLEKAESDPTFASSTFTFKIPDGAEQVDQFASAGSSSGRNEKNKMATNFELPSLKGDMVSLKQFRGKVVLIDFWATWCAPCRKAHPHIQKLYDKYKDDGLVVLGINNEGEETARKYMEEHNYTFRTLIDADNSVSRKYSVQAIPNVYIIGRDGKVADHLIGYRPEEAVERALKQAGL